jgi:hypothetical protein
LQKGFSREEEAAHRQAYMHLMQSLSVYSSKINVQIDFLNILNRVLQLMLMSPMEELLLVYFMLRLHFEENNKELF